MDIRYHTVCQSSKFVRLIRGRDASNAIIIMPCSSLFVKELLIRRNATRLALPLNATSTDLLLDDIMINYLLSKTHSFPGGFPHSLKISWQVRRDESFRITSKVFHTAVAIVVLYCIVESGGSNKKKRNARHGVVVDAFAPAKHNFLIASKGPFRL